MILLKECVCMCVRVYDIMCRAGVYVCLWKGRCVDQVFVREWVCREGVYHCVWVCIAGVCVREGKFV